MTKRWTSRVLVAAGIATLAGLWAFAVTSGSFVIHHGPVADAGQIGAFLTLCGVLGLGAGALILSRRPDRWSGLAFQLVALTSVAGQAREGLGSVTPVLGALWLGTLLFPGALAWTQLGAHKRWERRLICAPMVIAACLGPIVALAAHGRAGANTTWWETPDVVHPALPQAQALFVAHTGVVVVAVAVVAALIVKRVVTSDRALRRMTAPVTVPALFWAAATGAGQLARVAGPQWAIGPGSGFNAPGTTVLEVLPLISVAGILVGIAWMELVVPRLRRTSAGLAVRSERGRTDVTSYLVRALGDPSVKVYFRGAGVTGWVDGAGRSATPASDDADRGLTIITRAGTELGAIEYDVSLNSQPESVELVVAAAALAIESERLVAMANARTEDARRLTARLVTSAEAARRELFDRLAEGPLPQLEAIESGMDSEDLVEASRRLQAVAAEVREISHGLYPSELVTGGLAAALTDVTKVPTERFGSAIEITAFLAADGDPGACITREQGRLVIALSEPLRDPAILARVAVLGGTVDGAVMTVPVAG